jgi:hypothetical protein
MTTLPRETRRRLEALLAERASRPWAVQAAGVLGCSSSSLLGSDRLLELLIVGARGDAAGTILPGVAGYGSEVTVQDLETGTRSTHRLMSADAMVIEEGHVSMDSAMGWSLLGRAAGDVVSVTLPVGERRLLIERVETLDAFLESLELPHERNSCARTGTDG